MINIEWVDENGKQLEEWADWRLPWDITLFRKHEQFENTQCLRFIDQHGDTTFNRLQLPFLIEELDGLLNLAEDPDEIKGIRSLLEFVKKPEDRIHIYLKFWGD